MFLPYNCHLSAGNCQQSRYCLGQVSNTQPETIYKGSQNAPWQYAETTRNFRSAYSGELGGFPFGAMLTKMNCFAICVPIAYRLEKVAEK